MVTACPEPSVSLRNGVLGRFFLIGRLRQTKVFSEYGFQSRHTSHESSISAAKRKSLQFSPRCIMPVTAMVHTFALPTRRKSPNCVRRIILHAIALLTVIIFSGLCDSGIARAQTMWTNPGLGSWNSASNWSEGLPVPSGNATIANGGTAEMTASNTTTLLFVYRNDAVSGAVQSGSIPSSPIVSSNSHR